MLSLPPPLLLLLSGLCVRTRGHDSVTSQAVSSWGDQTPPSHGLCRSGNSMECCWGWKRSDWGRCEPHCQQGCKHGECVGPDRCKCHPGYTGKTCNQDLNECGVKPRPCKHRCMNTLGTYKCYCLDGYALQPDGSCRNAQTCYHANCQYGCEVIKGSVRCTCPSPGLRLGPDKRTCVDIDECFLGGGVCPRRRKCVNTFGSFICKCHLGFRLMYINGRYTCIDKDTRPFCSLNPSSPKCRCTDGGCKAIPKVTVEPQRPRTAAPITSVVTTATPDAATTAVHPATTTATTVPTATAAITTTFLSTSTEVTTTAPTPTTDATTTPVTPAAATTISSTTPPPTTALVTTTEMETPSPTAPPPPPPPPPAPTTTIPSTTTPTTTMATTTTLPTTAELDTTTQTVPPPPPTTTTTTTTPAVTTMLPTTSLPTTTVNNMINKDVTHKQRGDVHIPRHPNHNQVWEFDIELGNIGDDPDVAVLHCTFNHGLCDWMTDREGDLHWETVHNPTGGRYLSVPELKAGQRSIRGARLAVLVVPSWSHGDLCFSFSHWLTGHHVGVLQLFIRKKGQDQRYGSALWSRTGGHGWRHTQVTLTARSLDRVLLKAERRIGQRGQIAVDDVTLRKGACR